MKIKLNKKAKLMLLNAMKTGHLEAMGLNGLFDCMPEDDARTFITVWALKLGGFDPFGIEPITGMVTFGDAEDEEEYKRREKDLADRERVLLEAVLRG